MKSFTLWLNENTSNITIGYDKLKKSLNQVANNFTEFHKEKVYNASNFNAESFLQEIQFKLNHYPLIKNLISALTSKNQRYIMDQYGKLQDWQSKQPYVKDMFETQRKIWTYLDTLSPIKDLSQEIIDLESKALMDSEPNMLKIKNIIEQAISRMPNWQGSPVRIEANAPQDEHGPLLQAADDAEIILGNDNPAPSFILFNINGTIEIDDVIEGGDTEFFQNPNIQSDYFNLINEIKKPGSTNKGKILTLYTARPKSDRNQYISTNMLPVNIFLTNDFNHAEGLGRDLGGNRDIWKVRIDSRYLTQTLDGRIKYYQVTTPNAPAKMDLIQSSSE